MRQAFLVVVLLCADTAAGETLTVRNELSTVMHCYIRASAAPGRPASKWFGPLTLDPGWMSAWSIAGSPMWDIAIITRSADAPDEYAEWLALGVPLMSLIAEHGSTAELRTIEFDLRARFRWNGERRANLTAAGDGKRWESQLALAPGNGTLILRPAEHPPNNPIVPRPRRP